MKKSIYISLVLIASTIFVGCGDDASFSNTNQGVAIVDCTTNDSVSNTTWTTVSSGDTITVTVGTELLWKQTNVKQVCVKITTPTGSAEVQ